MTMLKRSYFYLIAITILFGGVSFTYAQFQDDAQDQDDRYLYKYAADAMGMITEVTDYNLGFFMKNPDKPRVVVYYSPYCPACIRFVPKYISFAKEVISKHSNKVDFYSVSCAAQKTVCNNLKINSYPTVHTYALGSKGGEILRASELGNAVPLLEERFNLIGGRVTAQINFDEGQDIDNEEMENASFSFDEEPQSGESEEGDDDDDEYDDKDDQSRKKTKYDRKDWKDGQRPGSATAKDLVKDMDRFKEEIANRLASKRRFGSPFRRHDDGDDADDGATSIMKAHTPGTDEFEDRRQRLHDKLARRRRGDAQAFAQKGKIEKLPYKKVVTKPRVVEKLPIVKRFTRMTPEEELILDSSLSFIKSLQYGVFREDKPLPKRKKMALEKWLDLMTVSLPQEWGLHELISDLREHSDYISENQKNLDAIIARHPLQRSSWSRSCVPKKGYVGNGFSCGLWKLFHVMTVGIAEHKGGSNLVESGLLKQGTPTFSPLKAADTLRNFISYFFTCSECRNHFLAKYDRCDNNRRCDRLAGKTAQATEADWKELAKWLWEFHNGVNVDVLNEREDKQRRTQQKPLHSSVGAGPGAATMKDQVSVLWPNLRDCFACYKEDGTWNEDKVFLNLEKTYWPASDMDPKTKRMLQFENDRSESSLTAFLVLVGLALFYFMNQSLSKSSIDRAILSARTMTRTPATSKRSD